MAAPWDQPPFPEAGDPDADMTYCGVGHVLSCWERVEVELARIYSIFVGKPNDLDAIKEYGDKTIFRRRADDLIQAFENFRVRHCTQDLEGDFEELTDRIAGWSARRNDVAHGIVEQTHNLRHYRELYKQEGLIRYVLIPSLYVHKRRDPNYQSTYCYSSQELHYFAAEIFKLVSDLEEFQQKHFPHAVD